MLHTMLTEKYFIKNNILKYHNYNWFSIYTGTQKF